MGRAKLRAAVGVGLAAVVLWVGCRSGSGPDSAPQYPALGRDKGAREAADAIAAGKLKLKEYPPLPSPADHGVYIRLLRDRCGVEYEVPSLPAGVAETDFIQEVRGWNEAMEAEIHRRHGAGILDRLHQEARELWQAQLNPKGKG